MSLAPKTSWTLLCAELELGQSIKFSRPYVPALIWFKSSPMEIDFSWVKDLLYDTPYAAFLYRVSKLEEYDTDDSEL